MSAPCLYLCQMCVLKYKVLMSTPCLYLRQICGHKWIANRFELYVLDSLRYNLYWTCILNRYICMGTTVVTLGKDDTL